MQRIPQGSDLGGIGQILGRLADLTEDVPEGCFPKSCACWQR